MTIKKIINNNVVTAIDESLQEVVLMGKGIGFQTKSGEPVDKNRIEKKFVLSNKDEIGKFEEVVSSIPIEHLDVCVEVINYAGKILGNRLSSSIYISLTDHINFALERYKTGIVFDNPLAQEVKSFYRREYEVGEYAVSLIEERLQIKLPADEAASIAMHFVNAEYSTAMSDTMHITMLIREIIEVIEKELEMIFDETDFHYSRYLTHLKFFAFRIIGGVQIAEQDKAFNDMVIQLYERSYTIVEKVAAYIQEHHQYTMNTSEKVNMTIHVQRIQMKDK